MHTLTFFPLGNADCCLINLVNRRKLLFDFGNERNPNDRSDKRIDLAAALLEDLENARRDYYDVVAFTHLDADHIRGATDFFWLEHDEKYQGAGRIKIQELWVPAAAIIQVDLEDEEARILQAEAQFRLIRNEGIRVFSRPARLDEWLEDRASDLTDDDLVIDAGRLVPTFDIDEDDVEFFVHSPFAEACEGQIVDRNEGCLVFQAIFRCDGVDTTMMLTDDTKCENLALMITTTEAHQHQHKGIDRLGWDVLRVPHHCSYLSLNLDGEKGKEITEPLPEIKRLYEEHAGEKSILISTSYPIPNVDTTQPPHRQAANYYKRVATDQAAQFIVTMEHPTAEQPQPLVITIDAAGPALHEPELTSPLAPSSSKEGSRIVGGTPSTVTSIPVPAGTGIVQIKAEVANELEGAIIDQYPSNGYALAKGKWLRFSIINEFATVPYTRRWRVENHGPEAAAADCLAYTIDRETGTSVWRVTAYTGSHYLICELISNDGRVIASTRHVVNVR